MSAAELREYNLDWHAVREHALPEHALRPGTATAAFARLSMDERWVVPTPADLLERSIAVWEEGFTLVVKDLLALPDSRTIVAEGPGALPWCVAPLLSSDRQAIFLVPTRERRDIVAERRWGAGQLDARIVSSCAELGLRCERLDGSQDPGDTLALVEDHFRERLPPTPNV